MVTEIKNHRTFKQFSGFRVFQEIYSNLKKEKGSLTLSELLYTGKMYIYARSTLP